MMPEGANTQSLDAFAVIDAASVPVADILRPWHRCNFEALNRAVQEGKAVKIAYADHSSREQWAFRLCEEIGDQNAAIIDDDDAKILYVVPRTAFPNCSFETMTLLYRELA